MCEVEYFIFYLLAPGRHSTLEDDILFPCMVQDNPDGLGSRSPLGKICLHNDELLLASINSNGNASSRKVFT